MAATAWTFYDAAKQKIGNGDILLDAGIWRMGLYTSASDASVSTQSVLSELSGEIVAQGGYAALGRTLGGIAWTIAGSPSSVKFDATDLIFTANGAALSNIKYAVIRNSAGAASGHLLCWSKLSASQFSVTTGNTLTVQLAVAGIFTLT
jgi:hypothetical protein